MSPEERMVREREGRGATNLQLAIANAREPRGRRQFSDEELVTLTMLIGCYGMISRAQFTLDVPQDEGFGGFEVP